MSAQTDAPVVRVLSPSLLHNLEHNLSINRTEQEKSQFELFLAKFISLFTISYEMLCYDSSPIC